MVKQRPIGLGLTKSGRPHYVKRDPSGWEDQVAKAWLEAHGRTQVQGPLGVLINFYPNGVVVVVTPEIHAGYRVARGDLDNRVKAVLDALNNVAWVDDHQIVHLRAQSLAGCPADMESGES